jgi:hypothetical protein
MTLREQLITVSDIYAHARKIGRQRLSTIVLSRGSTLDRVALGQSDITTRTFEAAMLWFSVHWPDEVRWPSDIPRPQPIQEAVE